MQARSHSSLTRIFFHRFFAAQLHKGPFDGALGLFNADIQKTHLFCFFVDFPTFSLFCG